MTDTTHNGWTNYETWRINLEIFDGGYWRDMTPERCQEIVEDIICDNSDNNIVQGWAVAFIQNVNWREIANHLNEMEYEEVTL